MKLVLFSLVTAFSATLVAAQADDVHANEIVRPGTGLKSVALVNTQNTLPQKEVDSVAALIDLASDINVRAITAKDGDPATILKASGSELVVIVKEDKTSPTMLIAPEDRWALVNLGKLVDDLPAERAKKKFFTSRARKEIIRAFSLLCGGGSSQFESNIMNSATVRGLDIIEEQIPADMSESYVKYLAQLGFRPKDWVPYEFACEEGWAPAPTNAAQKAIWDKVHAMPAEPIKIKPETKKVEK